MKPQRRKLPGCEQQRPDRKVAVVDVKALRREMTAIARGHVSPAHFARDTSFNSLAALLRFLDPPNRQLLSLMRQLGPTQISRLASKSSKPLSEIRRVLTAFRSIGLVKMDTVAGRCLWSALPVRVHITIDPFERDDWIEILVRERVGR